MHSNFFQGQVEMGLTILEQLDREKQEEEDTKLKTTLGINSTSC